MTMDLDLIVRTCSSASCSKWREGGAGKQQLIRACSLTHLPLSTPALIIICTLDSCYLDVLDSCYLDVGFCLILSCFGQSRGAASGEKGRSGKQNKSSGLILPIPTSACISSLKYFSKGQNYLWPDVWGVSCANISLIETWALEQKR